MKRVAAVCFLLLWASNPMAQSQETLFSGPQPGEALLPFRALAVNGPDAGREIDYISRYGDSPILLIFAHYIDRNVYRILWPCDRYAAERASAGLKTLYVYLAPEKVAGERRMAQVVKSLSLEVPAAVSLDGEEGPGAYALNKQAAVTAIVAKDRKVVANLTLVQPGLTDSPKIIAQAAKLVGGHIPTSEELNRGPGARMAPARTSRNQTPGAPSWRPTSSPGFNRCGRRVLFGACWGRSGERKDSMLGSWGTIPSWTMKRWFTSCAAGESISSVPRRACCSRSRPCSRCTLGRALHSGFRNSPGRCLPGSAAGRPINPRRSRITGLTVTPAVALAESARKSGS